MNARFFLMILLLWNHAWAEPAPPVALLSPTGKTNTLTESSTATPSNEAPATFNYEHVELEAINGNPENALEQLNKHLSAHPDDARAAYSKGLILMQLKRVDEAERWFKMMQSNFPNVTHSYNALAVIYSGRGDLLSAQSVLEALLRLQPQQQTARLNLAKIYLRLAQENYSKALKADPKNDKIARTLTALKALQ